MVPSLPVKDVLAIVSDQMGISVISILSSRRDAPTIKARHIAIWLCHRYCNRSYEYIGQQIGDRDHATIISAVRACKAKMANDPALNQLVQAIETVVKNASAAYRGKFKKLESEINPYTVATRIMNSDRNEIYVTVEEMRAMAEALISHISKQIQQPDSNKG